MIFIIHFKNDHKSDERANLSAKSAFNAKQLSVHGNEQTCLPNSTKSCETKKISFRRMKELRM